MNTDKRKYDLICSLGGNCAAAFQLKYRGMRPFSLPFDWTYIENGEPLEYLCAGFADGFENLALKENLKRVEGNESHPVIYQDTYSGYFFPNHFKADAEREYDVFNRKIRRRISRLIDGIKSAKSVLFILSVAFPIGDDCLKKLSETLTRLYPDVHFDFEVLSFGCSQETETTNGSIRLHRFVRQQNLYDFYKTNFEWAFLDKICLTKRKRDTLTLLSVKIFGRRFRLNFEIKRSGND